MNTNINEHFYREEFSLLEWEQFLEAGWDRVGDYFFHRRYDFSQVPFLPMGFFFSSELLPLRYKLDGFMFSKSQRIILKKNADLKRVYQPIDINEEKLALFDRWYLARFGKESSIFTWVSNENKPFPTHEVSFYKNDKLIACSFFDITANCQYSTTAMFDPLEKHRSLGTLTLLAEIEYGIDNQRKHHYPGHAYMTASVYDYKKYFNNMERFDWDLQKWVPLERLIKKELILPSYVLGSEGFRKNNR
jgi:leucyl-tRNA---protein transferase